MATVPDRTTFTPPTDSQFPVSGFSPYDEAMSSSEKPAEDSIQPIETFLIQPAYHASEDSPVEPLDSQQNYLEAGGLWQRLGNRFTRFMFEKKPGQYSSISPRTPDGGRTKIFFFNGNGRGR